MNFTPKNLCRRGAELVSQTTIPSAIMGDNIGIADVTSIIFRARRKVARNGRARRARFLLLSFLDHPCVGLKD